jgi:glycosyltransferase involved in cell wall biosynthesis
MRIAIVSAAYLAAENRKNIAALARHAEVRVISPNRPLYGVFTAAISAPAPSEGGAAYALYPLQRLAGPLLRLDSPGLGLAGFAPDIVQVEHDPWTALFRQAARARRRHAPKARLLVLAKKNTYRRYPGIAGHMKDRLARRGIAGLDHVLAASRMTAALYREVFGLPEERVSVVHHMGVDTDLFAPAESGAGRTGSAAFTIGYCGRLEPHKGIQDLLAAVARLRETRPIRLRLLGEGSLAAPLAARARAEDWIEVSPTVPHAEVAPFLRGLDLFCLPARVLPDHQEHDAHALMEAMACGIPCIGARSGIIPELLGGETGLLVPPADPAALAEAIAALAGDAPHRAGLGEAARRAAVAEFSLDAVARRRMEIYRHVLET